MHRPRPNMKVVSLRVNTLLIYINDFSLILSFELSMQFEMQLEWSSHQNVLITASCDRRAFCRESAETIWSGLFKWILNRIMAYGKPSDWILTPTSCYNLIRVRSVGRRADEWGVAGRLTFRHFQVLPHSLGGLTIVKITFHSITLGPRPRGDCEGRGRRPSSSIRRRSDL